MRCKTYSVRHEGTEGVNKSLFQPLLEQQHGQFFGFIINCIPNFWTLKSNIEFPIICSSFW